MRSIGVPRKFGTVLISLETLPHASVTLDARSREALALLASGGDARIVLDPATGLNRYLSAPYPRDVLAYASSTANDISAPAFARVVELAGAEWGSYAERLERLRRRIRAAYALDASTEIVFAPSGTDLEYVALAAALGKAAGGIHNVLLGADEVGSGCIHSAHGRYFAGETARGIATEAAKPVPGIGEVSLADVAVRCEEGRARDSREIAEAVEIELKLAAAMGRYALVHVVHGSKTGLILPEPAEIDRLRLRYGSGVTFVVDACQARITSEAIAQYLARDAVVFLTGSKFMGGPPFSGFALVPPTLRQSAAPLPSGFADIFRRAEWPEGWAGRGLLADEDNPGLWLRLEASVFELERFQRFSLPQVKRIIGAFQRALHSEMVAPLGLGIVAPHAPQEAGEAREHQIEMRTLVTLDASSLPGARSFDDACALHRRLAANGVRLGQPVRSVRSGGEWGGTLRVGLSMPQFTAWAGLDDGQLDAQLRGDMALIAQRLSAGG
jgi:selenocysteine lyase/cysteine desulfurase